MAITTPVRGAAWRFVISFGIIALLSDLVYEGARSVIGPYLGTLGASAAVVGVVTGVGEAFALVGRLGTGPLADRTRAYWPIVLAGYGLTMLAVPLLGLTSVLWVALALVIAERAGKAIRSPAKDVMLSHAAGAVGRGKGFAVHEALDQIGAVAGPLLVAGILVATAGRYGATAGGYIAASYRPAFLALAVPGAVVMVLLVRLRRRVPDPGRLETAPDRALADADAVQRLPLSARLPGAFWNYFAFTALTTIGYATFGVLSFHLATRHVIPLAAIPLVYAAAMAVDALAALASGWLYDRAGLRILIVVPILSALVPVLAFRTAAGLAIAGVLIWGAVLGVQESTMRAAVADLVPTPRRGTAYGVFAAGFGIAAFAGGALAGTLYDRSVTDLIIAVAGIQVLSLAVFAGLLGGPMRRHA